MTAARPPAIWSQPHGQGRPVRVFHPDQCADMPTAAASFLRHAIAPGARLGRCARIAMHGKIKLGGWIPFRADELIDTQAGFWWDASVARGLLTTSDNYADGAGSTRINALGLVPIKLARGPDITKSAIGRFVGEQAVFLPGTLLESGFDWTGADAEHATVTTTRDGEHVQLNLHIAADGHLRDLTMSRWGPVARGRYHYVPFGIEIEDERTFGDFTIPCSVRAGWWYGTPRWHRSEFFRFTIDEFTVF